jgi:hypothetical protein
MRKFLAIWLSCLTMAGAAQAATIDGNFDVVAGVPEDYTFNFDMLPGETFGSVAFFSANSTQIVNPPFTLSSTGVGQLSFGRSFELTDKSLSVFAVINIKTTGYYFTCNAGIQGSYVGDCASYVKVTPAIVDGVVREYSSAIEFYATTPISVMTAEQNFQRLSLTREAFVEAAVVPIAGTLPLLLSGLGLLGWFARRQRVATA